MLGAQVACHVGALPVVSGWAIETLRAALNTLAVAAPEWLRRHADPAWTDRYAKPADDDRIPKGDDARLGCAEEIGRDGHALLAVIAAPDAPAWLREVPAAALLWRVWIQNFRLPPVEADAKPGANGFGEDGMLVRWRTTEEGFPTSLLDLAAQGRLALRSGRALRQEARHHLGRLQGSPDGNMRRRTVAPGHSRSPTSRRCPRRLWTAMRSSRYTDRSLPSLFGDPTAKQTAAEPPEGTCCRASPW